MFKKDAREIIVSTSRKSCLELNDFSKKVLQTRGGRIGSGMGLLIEALWGYYTNQELINMCSNFEIAWFPDHQYNDFACVHKNIEWDPITREGELFRIEVKSMNTDADESKAHFDELFYEMNESDLLLVILWEWKMDEIDSQHSHPSIIDHFIGPVKEIARLRDELHIARGGSFVTDKHCPDSCHPHECLHDGEPLNAAGKRERLSGPRSCRPSANVSYAANFGGLLRMLKTSSDDSHSTFCNIRKECDICHEYISFIYRNFPLEEKNQYSMKKWTELCKLANIDYHSLQKAEVVELVREKVPSYMEKLRQL